MKIYFSGIGGVGLGPLAEIALDAGYSVVGSDLAESPLTAALAAKGVAISYAQDGAFLRQAHADGGVDWFVYTSALPDNHPELVLARELGLRTGKRDELLAHIIAEKNLQLIAIAGTHGKTTTTGMMVWTLKQLGVPVSYSIGTTVSFGPSGAYDPKSEYFVYECDEYDRNFLHFSPTLSVITSLDYDHPDTYPTEQEYLDAFKQFVAQSLQTVAWQADAARLDLHADEATILPDNAVAPVELAGIHNRRNATLVIAAIERLGGIFAEDSTSPVGVIQDKNSQLAANGLEEKVAAEALKSFPGTHRRFEKLAENLYTDYGHHPVEIAATLQMARELSDHVVLVYQPHQNRRQHEIRDTYSDEVFGNADDVYWLPTYLSREDEALEVLTPETLTARVSNAHVADFDDELWRTIQTARAEGKLVLGMGAGTIDAWLRQKLSEEA